MGFQPMNAMGQDARATSTGRMPCSTGETPVPHIPGATRTANAKGTRAPSESARPFVKSRRGECSNSIRRAPIIARRLVDASGEVVELPLGLILLDAVGALKAANQLVPFPGELIQI